MDLLLSLLVIPLVILILTGPASAVVTIVLLARDSRRAVFAFWLALAAASIPVGLFMAYTFGGFFPGSGFSLCLLTPIVALVTFLLFRFRAKRFNEMIGENQAAKRLFLIGSLLLPSLQIVAPLVSFGFSRLCDSLNRDRAQPIIAALEEYKRDAGSYPEAAGYNATDLKPALTPAYLADWPGVACELPPPISDWVLFKDNDFTLYPCANSPNNDTFLLAPIMGSDTKQTYHLASGQWSVGSTFDGFCP
jgi:hypothetical protein